MCIAVKMKLLDVKGEVGRADLSGVVKEVSLALIEDVKVGDYVLIHAGFAIQKIDEEEALKTISLLKKPFTAGDRVSVNVPTQTTVSPTACPSETAIPRVSQALAKSTPDAASLPVFADTNLTSCPYPNDVQHNKIVSKTRFIRNPYLRTLCIH